MLPVTDGQAAQIIKGELSLKGSDFSQTTTEDGKKLVTKFLRKHGTNELFLYTDALALRGDMVPTTEAQAALIRGGQVDFKQLENVQINPEQPPPNPDDGRVDMTEPPPQPPNPNPGEPPPGTDGTVTEPPNGGQGTGPTGPAGAGAGGPGVTLSDAKQEQIAKLGTMSKDELVAFGKDKFQVDIDKRKSEDKIREIVTGLIQDNP
jgi:hypothetical protein